MIQVRSALGMDRQIFFASIGGFDNHSDLVQDQAPLLAQLDVAVGAFQAAFRELAWNKTSSPLRNLNSAALVTPAPPMVRITPGADITSRSADPSKVVTLMALFRPWHCRVPTMSAIVAVWLPSTSLDQYAATMASWFGVPDSSLGAVFPNLPNFTAQKLGFL